MNKVEALDRFFSEYERTVNSGLAEPEATDGKANAEAFADCFFEASPAGIVCRRNDADFRARLPQGFEFYKKLGTSSMKILSLLPAQLDEHHWTVKIRWGTVFREEAAAVEFDVIYLVQDISGRIKIIGCIAGEH
ncbi:MAG TPA: hypothetical protein V6D08_07155 [Candidatus Obscuribacterales bacterium]